MQKKGKKIKLRKQFNDILFDLYKKGHGLPKHKDEHNSTPLIHSDSTYKTYQAQCRRFVDFCYTQSKYRLMTEFAVQTGTSHHARRIDALILENRTVEAEKPYNLHAHAIEIKVSKHDLLSDHKMQEYTDYADFFWIAVPEELKADAESIMLNDWGLITIDDRKELHVIKKAELHDAIFRDKTIETALIKIL